MGATDVYWLLAECADLRTALLWCAGRVPALLQALPAAESMLHKASLQITTKACWMPQSCSLNNRRSAPNLALPADPTILIDTTALYGAKHNGVTVVPSSGGRKVRLLTQWGLTHWVGRDARRSGAVVRPFPCASSRTANGSGCTHDPSGSQECSCLLGPIAPSIPRSCSPTASVTTPAAGRSRASCWRAT